MEWLHAQQSSSKPARMIVHSRLGQWLSCLYVYMQQEVCKTNNIYVNRTATAIGTCSARLLSGSVSVSAAGRAAGHADPEGPLLGV